MKILLFGSDGCTPCSQLGRWMINNKISFVAYDLFVDGAEFRKYAIMSTPTVVILNDLGVEIHRAIGLVPCIGMLRALMPGPSPTL